MVQMSFKTSVCVTLVVCMAGCCVAFPFQSAGMLLGQRCQASIPGSQLKACGKTNALLKKAHGTSAVQRGTFVQAGSGGGGNSGNVTANKGEWGHGSGGSSGFVVALANFFEKLSKTDAGLILAVTGTGYSVYSGLESKLEKVETKLETKLEKVEDGLRVWRWNIVVFDAAAVFLCGAYFGPKFS